MFPDPENIDKDTSFVVFACLVAEILQKIGNLAAILFMQIRQLKMQNFAWELGLSDSACPDYAKKPSSQLLPQNAPSFLCKALFQKSH